MDQFDNSALNDLLKTLQNNLPELHSSLTRAFDTKIKIEVVESGQFDTSLDLSPFKTPCLLLLSYVQTEAIGVLIPQSSGLIPDWCDQPSVTEKSKLSTLAQEWGMNLLPEVFFPDDFETKIVQNIHDVVNTGGLGKKPGYVLLQLKDIGGKSGKAMILWPLTTPRAIIAKQPAPTTKEVFSATVPPSTSRQQSFEPLIGSEQNPFSTFNIEMPADEKTVTLDDLPGFTRSLLKIKLPVSVVLAQSKRPIKMILELGVGSVIQFDKSCDTFLELKIGNSILGTGEAVKVGDKFGLRIQSITLPEERFRQINIRKDKENKHRSRGPAFIGKAYDQSDKKY